MSRWIRPWSSAAVREPREGQARHHGRPGPDQRPASPANPAIRSSRTTQLTLAAPEKFVSRGGHKLEHALDHFQLDVAGLTAIDLGASTGGFTDCLLQRGAAKVYAVDVGQGQLAWKLRQDPRVVVMEKTNARDLTPAQFPAAVCPGGPGGDRLLVHLAAKNSPARRCIVAAVR